MSFSLAEMTSGGIRSFYDNKVKARLWNIISTTQKYQEKYALQKEQNSKLDMWYCDIVISMHFYTIKLCTKTT